MLDLFSLVNVQCFDLLEMNRRLYWRLFKKETIMNVCRVAIIGLGRMGSTIDEEVVDYPAVALPYSIAACCAHSDRLELVAGADLLPEKRDAFGAKWGTKALYDDYVAMKKKSPIWWRYVRKEKTMPSWGLRWPNWVCRCCIWKRQWRVLWPRPIWCAMLV
jgi:hypothetical protein